VWENFFVSERGWTVCVLGLVFVSVCCFGRCLACALGAVSCCLGCVPAHFYVAESDVLRTLGGFAGKRILEEEGGKRLTPSSTCRRVHVRPRLVDKNFKRPFSKVGANVQSRKTS
jgi:hypothetical protein